jgi:hypothetical protein
MVGRRASRPATARRERHSVPHPERPTPERIQICERLRADGYLGAIVVLGVEPGQVPGCATSWAPTPA